MASTLFSALFVCVLLITTFSFGSQAKAKQTSPSLQAQELLKSFNLSPKHPLNIVPSSIDESFLVDHSKLHEWKLEFPQVNGNGPSVQDYGHRAGYYKLSNTSNAKMFYMFFESRNSSSKDPVLIWLSGGPGCSSQLALFYENGPFKITNNLSLVWNEYGWDQASNILFVDQPIGTGFSPASDNSEIPSDEKGVTNDLYKFIQAFFAEHSQLAKNDFYITGESYAGHYVPAFATRVNEGNKKKEGLHINLKGIAIGNGLTDPAIQYDALPDFALSVKLIDQSDYKNIKETVPQCKQSIEECASNTGDSCLDAFENCQNIFSSIKGIAGNINYYDYRKPCEGSLCYDFSNMETFLNEKSVREALGVGDIEFVSCSTTVYDSMLNDFMKNYAVGIPALINDGIRVLIYAGEYDLICNWLGNSNWVDAMQWPGQKEFRAAKTTPFVVDGKTAGELKSHGPLIFLKVHNAGHLVPMDQPKPALQMLRNWMQNTLA